MELMKKMLAGDVYSLAKIITMAENNPEAASEIMKEVFRHQKGAHVIGVTGPPGAGKSSLVYMLAKNLHDKKNKVAILAVDPSSPFTGGALLGDRIRMNQLSVLEDVYIRSISNRGAYGGLSVAAYYIVKILDACGYNYIFLETVGTGQSEVKVMNIADTTMVVQAPGLGDSIQAIKAGILEIGDIFVVNKCDKDGADKLSLEMENMLKFNEEKNWHIPVVQTNAQEGDGIENLIQQIDLHKKTTNESYSEKEKRQLEIQLSELIEEKFHKLLKEKLLRTDEFGTILDSILKGETEISNIVDSNLKRLLDENYKK